jgi:hypothetical protein
MKANTAAVLALGAVVLNPAIGYAQLATHRDWMSLVGLGNVEVRLVPLDLDVERRFTLDRDRVYSDIVRRLTDRGVPVSRERAGAVLHVEISFLKVRDPIFVYSLQVSLHQAVDIASGPKPPTGPVRVVAPTWVRSHLGTTGELHGPQHMIRQLVDEFASDYRLSRYVLWNRNKRE